MRFALAWLHSKMVSVTLICVLAVYIPFAQGNDQDGIRGKHLQKSNVKKMTDFSK